MSLGPLTKVAVSPSPGVLEELAEFFSVEPEGEPAVVGYYDRGGKLRRVVAQYPDGWRMQVNVSASGHVTSSHARIKYNLKAGGDGA